MGPGSRPGRQRWQFFDSIFKEELHVATRHREERNDEAIHFSHSLLDGLLRRACHRARIRATRWLAMTVPDLQTHHRTLAARNARGVQEFSAL
jgi:hypothetical protein